MKPLTEIAKLKKENEDLLDAMRNFVDYFKKYPYPLHMHDSYLKAINILKNNK